MQSQPGTPQKVLVTGAAHSSIKSFVTKLTALQAKHSFSLCLALDLFSGVEDDSLELAELLAGKIVVPVQVYVAVGGGVIPQKVLDKVARGEEVCTNVTLLGKSGLLTLASGLKIATFGGSYDEALFESPDSTPSGPHFTSASLTSFLSTLSPAPSNSSLPAPPAPSADILITHALPSSLPLLSAKPLVPTPGSSCAPLDALAKAAHDKYHFVGGAGVFWEREPFAWPREEGGGVCRAICLGEMGNKAKERWFYAFSITPRAAAPPNPANATASPFSATPSARGTKRPAGSLDTDLNEYGVPNYIFGGGDRGAKKGRGGAGGPPPDHYTCNICGEKGHWIQECPNRAERDAARPPRGDVRPIQPDECWFCLSNPKLTKHLIASIGSETYLTLPKGQLPPTRTSGATSEVSPVPGGGHVLLIPIAHYPTLLSIPGDLAEPIISEIDKYKMALRDCYATFGAKLVAFEVGRLSGKGGHAHVQICPVPADLAPTTEAVFRAEGEKQGIVFEEDGAAALERSNVSENYFRVDLPDGSMLVHLIQPGAPFNLQFGRATMAVLLGIQERTDWKACTKLDAEEKADCQRFKAAFKKFDPSE